MASVRVTIAMGRKIVSLDDVRDPRVVNDLRQAARALGVKLERVTCPTHGKSPADVRLHFDASGNGDLKYESCCEELGKAVGLVV
jgi:hypothetical protein